MPPSTVHRIALNRIEPNPDQPRHYFDDERLRELADSIKVHGVLQPLLVKRAGDHFQLLAGERRWRASKLAGLDVVPVLIEDVTDEKQLEIALIENLQREDLNAIEEARAYQSLVAKYKLTQEEVSQRVGRSRAAIANSLRLLRLPTTIQRDIESGLISAGHARAILSLESTEKQTRLHKMILADDLSVREAERMARALSETKTPALKPQKDIDPQIKALEDRLMEALGTVARLKPTSATMGRIEIAYNSLDELDRILMLIGVQEETV